MVDLSLLQLDENREVVIQEHDRGINLRDCPFTRTCWVMFLAFPLDFQTREIINQAVGFFGTVVTWTNNANCRSRILLRCKVTQMSRIPRSLIICQGNLIADQGSSWFVPVFVLNSQFNDVGAVDVDLVPPNGNPHPVNGHFLQNQNQNQGWFDDLGDLDQVEQANIDEGWEAPLDPPLGVNGWG